MENVAEEVHVKGKIIASANFGKEKVEIKFTDGSEIDIRIERYGYDGSSLDNTFHKGFAEGHLSTE